MGEEVMTFTRFGLTVECDKDDGRYLRQLLGFQKFAKNILFESEFNPPGYEIGR